MLTRNAVNEIDFYKVMDKFSWSELGAIVNTLQVTCRELYDKIEELEKEIEKERYLRTEEKIDSNERQSDLAPGSDEAIEAGCICPVLDNSHGKGYFGGPIDEKTGEPSFVINLSCPLHGVHNDGQK